MIGIVITMLMHFYIEVYVYIQGFPKIKNIGDTLSDDKESKIKTKKIILNLCK